VLYFFNAITVYTNYYT